MKVVCIDNTIGNARHLELNKVYDASEISSFTTFSSEYYIVNTYPFGIPIHKAVRLKTKKDIWIDKRAFISLEEFRQSKLDKILKNEI
jgi:hypothetical protein